MLSYWDYWSIGTIGFAQVGTADYESRVIVEKMIITAFFTTHDDLKVPDNFQTIARFDWVLCPHDFGSYWDFQILYDRACVDDWECSEEEEEQEYYSDFMDWANKCESAISKNEEILLEWCNLLYQKNVTMKIVHRTIEEYQDLKKVDG